MTELQVITEKDPHDIATLSLKGSIDAYSCEQLEEVVNRLLAENIYKFVVDLSQVDYMSKQV